MESLAYYESEDDQEIENNNKIGDVSPLPMNTINNSKRFTNEHTTSSSRPSSTSSASSSLATGRTVSTAAAATSKKSAASVRRANYDSVQMELSEDSDGSSGKNSSQYRKPDNYEAKSKHEPSGHRRSSDDDKKSKGRDRDRDYEKRDYKINDRERLGKHRYRDDKSSGGAGNDRYRRERDNKSSRSDKDDSSYRDRDKDRGKVRERDRDKFRERERERSDKDSYRNRNHHRQYDKHSSNRERERDREPKPRVPAAAVIVDRDRTAGPNEVKRRSPSPRDKKCERKAPEVISPPSRPPPPPPPAIEENSLVVTALPLDTTSNNINLSFIEKRKEKVLQLEKMGIDIKAATVAPGGVGLPSYYNPGVINPTKYADQVQKRKLLWSHKKNEQEQAAAKWESAKFSQDQDGKVASKFMRLMGIKDAPPKPSGESSKTQDLTKKQEELFSTMEQQYEVARQVTHTMRGVGLGFGSQPRQF